MKRPKRQRHRAYTERSRQSRQAGTKSQSIAENRNEQPAQATTFVAARPIAALLQGCDSAEAILELVELQGNSFQHGDWVIAFCRLGQKTADHDHVFCSYRQAGRNMFIDMRPSGQSRSACGE